MGTDDRTLIRVVVSRCEVDMKQIKEEFQRRYGQGLEAFIRVSIHSVVGYYGLHAFIRVSTLCCWLLQFTGLH